MELDKKALSTEQDSFSKHEADFNSMRQSETTSLAEQKSSLDGRVAELEGTVEAYQHAVERAWNDVQRLEQERCDERAELQRAVDKYKKEVPTHAPRPTVPPSRSRQSAGASGR